MANTLQTLTVGQLREMLALYDDDMPAVVACGYGDSCDTKQAVAIGEVADNVFLSETCYGDSGFKVVEDGDQEEGDQEVVVLNYDIL